MQAGSQIQLVWLQFVDLCSIWLMYCTCRSFVSRGGREEKGRNGRLHKIGLGDKFGHDLHTQKREMEHDAIDPLIPYPHHIRAGRRTRGRECPKPNVTDLWAAGGEWRHHRRGRKRGPGKACAQTPHRRKDGWQGNVLGPLRCRRWKLY